MAIKPGKIKQIKKEGKAFFLESQLMNEKIILVHQ
jgi:hypothetical protein